MKSLVLILLFSTKLYAQVSPSTPCTPNQGSFTFSTTQVTFWACATDGMSWNSVQPQFSFPSGFITLITTGSCPATWSEITSLNGKMLRGTLAANGNVGQSGGNDTITPTINSLNAAAQIFTGNSITSSAVSAGTPSGTNSTGTVTPLGTNGSVSITPLGTNAATITSGNCAATNLAIGTGATTACKATAPNLTVPAETFTGSSTTVGAQTFTGSSSITSAETFTGSALATHTHTTTATGNNGTSSVTGTMNSFDNRPAYLNVIFCGKN